MTRENRGGNLFLLNVQDEMKLEFIVSYVFQKVAFSVISCVSIDILKEDSWK